MLVSPLLLPHSFNSRFRVGTMTKYFPKKTVFLQIINLFFMALESSFVKFIFEWPNYNGKSREEGLRIVNYKNFSDLCGRILSRTNKAIKDV